MTTMTDPHRIDVPLAQASRLLNHGPTVLVSAAHGGQRNLMAAAWAMPLDFEPPKVAVVIDKATFTRRLIDASGRFALQLPCAAQADLCFSVGSSSGAALAEAGTDKFERLALRTFAGRHGEAPLVAGCVAWLECRVIAWPAVQAAHDLFLAEVLGAQADGRVFVNGRWQFDAAPPALRTLHHLGGGQFVLPGDGLRGQLLPGLAAG
ncbi:flavin reductase [Rubrivivax pictus]|uniref:Flavin reductase n=2 Tax=Pseudaquabacterium pictum TaxID=2315236 RepID=A0A480ALX6_9BURK|nr:flavin reductase [Rubrivivax pictus]